MALGKRVWRILKESKGRYIGIVLLILLGSFYFIAATGISGNLEKMVVGFAGEHRQEDLTFTTSRPVDDLPALERDTAAQIDPTRQADIKLPDGELRLLGQPARINTPAVLSG